MKSLSLFDQVKLDSAQIDALPAHIRKNIFEGYSEVLNDSRMAAAEPAVERIRFAAKTTAEGDVQISYDGVNFVDAGPLENFPRLLTAMRAAYDSARVQFPSSFRDAEPIEKVRIYPPEHSSPLTEARAVAVDVNSAIRNGCAAGKVCAPFVAFSGVAGGGLSLFVGAETVIEETQKYDRAAAIGDEEGKSHALIHGAMGLMYGLAGLDQFSSFFPAAYSYLPGPEASSNANLAGYGFGYASNVFTIGLSLSVAAASLHEWRYISEFREGLTSILGRDVSQQKKAMEGLSFLQQQLSLTAEDWGDLADKGLDRDVEAINKKYLEKHDRFVRRVGDEAAERIAKELVQALADLKAGKPEALKNAKELIELADCESFKKRVEEITHIAISILIISATVCSLILGGNTSPIIYVIDSVCWLTVDAKWLHDKIGRAAYSLFSPSDEKRWGNSVEKGDFHDKILQVYKVDGQWNLAKIKNDIVVDIPRIQLFLNGNRVDNFGACQRELGLEGLDFTNRRLDEAALTGSQKKGLEFLAMLNQGIIGDSTEDLVAVHGHSVTDEPNSPLLLDAHYISETGAGTIQARNRFCLRHHFEDPLPYQQIEAGVEVDGIHHRTWTRVA